MEVQETIVRCKVITPYTQKVLEVSFLCYAQPKKVPGAKKQLLDSTWYTSGVSLLVYAFLNDWQGRDKIAVTGL